MDIFSTPFSGSLKRYWRRRKYQRLNGATIGKKNLKIVRLGRNIRRSRKIRAIPKLRLKIVSPFKILARLRDAYVDTMVGLAGKVVYLNNINVFGGKRVPKDRQIQTVPSSDVFDVNLVLHIYKSLVASRELAAF